MKIIPLTKGFVAKVDDEDYKMLIKYKWHVHTSKKKGRQKHYAKGYITPEWDKNSLTWSRGYQIFMHRFILNCPKDMVVDHINGDSLDNTRANIRLCTPTVNNFNKHHYAQKPITNIKRTGSQSWRVRFGGKHYGTYNKYSHAEVVAHAIRQTIIFGENNNHKDLIDTLCVNRSTCFRARPNNVQDKNQLTLFDWNKE